MTVAERDLESAASLPAQAPDRRLWLLADVLIGGGEEDPDVPARTARYLERRWGTRRPSLADGLERLDAETRRRTGRALDALDGREAQALVDALLRPGDRAGRAGGPQVARFLDELNDLAHEGFYASDLGGDRPPDGWAALGYRPVSQ